MKDDVYCIYKQYRTKDATNAEEASHAAVEDWVNVGSGYNLVSEEQIRNADHDGEHNFANEKKYFEQPSFWILIEDIT